MLDIVGMANILTLGAFVFGIFEYRSGQKWKRSELAAKELEKLNSDAILLLACQILDYGSRELLLPDRFSGLTSEKTIRHNQQLLSSALRTSGGMDELTWQEVAYRDTFDYFFTYLDRMGHYVKVRLIDIEDITPLRYWYAKMQEDSLKNSLFAGFMKEYGYHAALNLQNQLVIRSSVDRASSP